MLSAPSASPGVSAAAATETKAINLLAYVHLRNIHGSTGAGRVARQLVEHLGRRGDVNLQILADANDAKRILPLVGEPWTSFNYRTFADDTSRQQGKWFLFGRPTAEDFWPDTQIAYCTAESYVPVRKARLAVTVHDAAYFEQGAHAPGRDFLKQKLKWKFLYRRLARKADMFHTVSHFSAERLSHFFPQIASRIRVVHNAVTPHFFEPVPQGGRDYLSQNGFTRQRYILVPGGLHFRKNAELILEGCALLMARFPELVIAIVNHSNPAYVERAKSLGPNLRILGFVEDSALHALYTEAAVVWFPSRYEGFGLPVVEAMACGAAVVASNSSSLPEIAGDAALLVDPADPAAHARAIEMLLTDDSAARQFSAAGRVRASMFTWESSADQLKRCFDALL
jgi:glycosyltransferase involved in cell wall biosynthesis